MIAQVILNNNAKDLNRVFDYNVPCELEKEIKIGSRVLAPFGNKKELEEGFVVGFTEKSEYKLKSIVKIEEDYLTDENIKIAKWMAKRYFCNISEAIKLMLPPGTKSKNIEARIKDKRGNFVYLNKDIEEINFEIENGKIKSSKQQRVLNVLFQNDGIDITSLSLISDSSKAVIKTLEKNGYIRIVPEKILRDPFASKNVSESLKLRLTDEQQVAFNKIEEAIADNMNSEFLLFGVTGSRKN